uniref:Uncharacterized protein n=1 Tax=Cacopsylla melanoneura TaxID=428564 RepID=A0A8D8U1X8_9HEMI
MMMMMMIMDSKTIRSQVRYYDRVRLFFGLGCPGPWVSKGSQYCLFCRTTNSPILTLSSPALVMIGLDKCLLVSSRLSFFRSLCSVCLSIPSSSPRFSFSFDSTCFADPSSLLYSFVSILRTILSTLNSSWLLLVSTHVTKIK